MKIKLNQIFSNNADEEFTQWNYLTAGTLGVPLNTAKGIEFFKKALDRTPLIVFHTNHYKEDQEQTPWRDLIFQSAGRVIYNGDNKSSNFAAHEARGNRKVLELINLYSSKSKIDRLKAPPIIITKTVKLKGRTGYRQFIGVGLINQSPKLVQQYEKKTNQVFSNYQFEVTLISLTPEEEFDWKWIDDRRNSTLDDISSLKHAPTNWKLWVEKGNEIISQIRLNIKSYRIIDEQEQKNMPIQNKKIINDLLNVYYPDPSKDGIRFEALASFITELYFENSTYSRGWITAGSSDRGVDFVGRLDIGHDAFSSNSLIVLGQSKRYKSPISGERLTRVASRMTRGYIGVVVTLDTFTRKAQEEIKDDQLPIILINGKKASELLLNYINRTGKTLQEIVEIEDEWSKTNIRTTHYSSIIDEI
ncbi:restriction endonuclease [Pedobacter frigoris]|uniref:restriction endonuclease n=1 Tax=Pedobacter frigoris TaxID=2571272 RepID=UPI00292E1A60|nr:restriction endonuclease [Pedobacter frigoris]